MKKIGRYFSLSEDVDNLRIASGAKEIASGMARLFGKTVNNAAVYAINEVFPEIIEKTIKNSKNSTTKR
jgi:hypothetical protein